MTKILGNPERKFVLLVTKKNPYLLPKLEKTYMAAKDT